MGGNLDASLDDPYLISYYFLPLPQNKFNLLCRLIISMSLYLCLKNLDPFLDHKGLSKLLNRISPALLPTHILKHKRKTFAYLKFPSLQLKQQFMKVPMPQEFKKLKTKEAFMKDYQIKQFIGIDQVFKEKQVTFKDPTPQELQQVHQIDIRDVISPLWKRPYHQQIALKKQSLERIIYKLTAQLGCDPIQFDFLQADKTTQYRNKTQFTVGLDSHAQIQVGFNKGSFLNRTITIADPASVQVIPLQALQVAALLRTLFRELEKESPEVKAYNRYEHDSGVWRYVVVRYSERTEQLSVMVVASTSHIDVDILEIVKKRLAQTLRTNFKRLQGVTFMQHNSKSDSIPYNPVQVLFGIPHYQEIILDCKFEVSPLAFLQGHTPMCEKLYSSIIANVKEADLVLDLCCGIGTIGICIGKRLPGVKMIGIELVQSACKDAVENAKANQVEYEVIAGKVEDKIKGVVQAHAGIDRKIVAIVDPPRAGLQKQSISSLRTCKGLNRIIYVACNLQGVIENVVGLCGNNSRLKGPSFQIEGIIGLDLFPSTTHFETIIILSRL